MPQWGIDVFIRAIPDQYVAGLRMAAAETQQFARSAGTAAQPYIAGMRMAGQQAQVFATQIRNTASNAGLGFTMAAGRVRGFVNQAVTPITAGIRTISREYQNFGTAMLQMPARWMHEAEGAARVIRNISIAGMIAFGLMIKSTASFEEQMRNVNSIALQTESQFNKTWTQVIALTREFPQSAVDMAKGLYDINSAGMFGAQGLAVLKASAAAASAGLSDTRTAARAIVGAMNAYGAAAGNAAFVSDVMFQTVKVGVVTFADLAQNMGQWIALAAQAHIPLEDVSAAYAEMTRTGLPAAEASTSLMRVIMAFMKPSEAMSALTHRLGFENSYAMLQTLGFKGAMDQILQSTNNSVPALARVFEEVRGLRGALALGAQDGAVWNQVLGEFGTKGDIAGSTARALAEQQKSLSYQSRILRNSLQEVAIQTGQYFLPVMKAGVGTLTSVGHGISALPAPLRLLAAGLGLGASGFGLFISSMILVAPRIVATRKAIEEMATTMPQLASAANFAQAAMGKFMLGIGIIGGVALLAANLGKIHDSIQDLVIGKANIGSLTTELARLASVSVQDNITPQFAKVINSARTGQKDIHEFSKELVNAVSIGGDSSDRRPAYAASRLRDIDKAMEGIVKSGHADMAQAALQRMAQGFNISVDQLMANLPKYRGAIEGVTAEAILSGHAVNSFGVSMEMSDEELQNAKQAAEDYKNSLKTLTTSLTDFVALKDSFSSITDAHDRMRQSTDSSAKSAAQEAKNQAEAAKARLEIPRIQERINRLSALAPSARRDERLAEERANLADAQEKVNAATEKALTPEQEYQQKLQDEKISLQELQTELQKRVDAMNAWEGNLKKLSPYLTPDAMRELIDAGPQYADVVAQMAKLDPNSPQFKKLNDLLSQVGKAGGEDYARALDIEMGVARVTGGKDTDLMVQDIITELNKLAPGMGATIPEVQAAAQALGISIAQGLAPAQLAFKAVNDAIAALKNQTPEIQTISNLMLGIGKITSQVNGPDAITIVITGQGGVPSTVTPNPPAGTTVPGAVAPAGNQVSGAGAVSAITKGLGGFQAQFLTMPTILAGERSTGGEAYIPLGQTHRTRSRAIWRETGKILAMADGGIVDPTLPTGIQLGMMSGGRPTQVTIVEGDHSTHVKREVHLDGPHYFQDAKASVEYMDRRERLNAMQGV